MTRMSFCDALFDSLTQAAPENCRITRERIPKNNGVVLDAFCISMPGSACSPIVYPDSLYEQYRSGKTVEAIAAETIDAARMEAPVSDGFRSELCDFEKMKDRIALRLVSAEQNADFLKDVPWIPFLDLAVVFYVSLGFARGGASTISIHNRLAESWEASAETLFELAKNNTPRLLPSTVRRLEELLFGPAFSDEEGTGGAGILPLYVLTNSSGVFGSACLLDTAVLDAFAEKAGSDFLVFPSSIHEVLLLPDAPDLDYDGLHEMIGKINLEAVLPEDRLSDSLYFYSRSEHALTILRSDASCTQETA